MLRTPTKATPRQNHLTQRLCYNQVLTTSCYVLNTELKVKNRMDVNVSAVHPHPRDHDPDWELHVACGHCPTLREKTLPPSASLRKDQNSKHSFYWICIPFEPSRSWKIVSQGQSVCVCDSLLVYRCVHGGENSKSKTHSDLSLRMSHHLFLQDFFLILQEIPAT